VIDAVTIIPKPDPADAPDVSIPPTPNQTEQTFTDLIVGDGAGIEPGQTVAVHLVAFSGRWRNSIRRGKGHAPHLRPRRRHPAPGLGKSVDGMKIGGRRQVQIPFADAFGEAGNSNLGLPASTDLIMILDLVAVY
jgi:peptidylprolyl isomerase